VVSSIVANTLQGNWVGGTVDADVYFLGLGAPFETVEGNVTHPGYTFANHTSTGFFVPTSNAIGVSVNGNEYLRIDPTGISVTGNVSGSFILGNGSLLTGLPATNNASLLTTGTVSNALLPSSISVPGNLTGSYVLGNGSFLTGVAQSPPVIANVQITDSSWNVMDDTAVSTIGGYVKINGSNFGITGSRVFYGGPTGIIPSPATTHVSATQIRATVPGFTAGSYDVMVYATSGAWGMLPSGLTVSPIPVWSTSGTLTSVKKTKPFSLALTSTSDSNVAYSLDAGSVLPPGTTLASNGVLAGNIVTDPGNATTYSFSVQATDLELQNVPRTFTLLAKKPTIQDQIAKLLASDGAASDYFGSSVALSSDGTTAIIGASYNDPSGVSNAGAAYIFKTSNGTTWTQIAKLTASDAAASDYFGSSVALSSDGSTAIVGAYYKSTVGASYIFKTSNGTTWTQIAKITASDAAANDIFGYSVGMSSDGTTAIIGAFGKSSNTGAAYVFKTSDGTTWTQIAKLTASDAATNDYFGNSVSISSDGTTAIVGAYLKSSAVGAAYIFKTSNGTTWTQIAKLLATDGAAGDQFGYSVGMSSDGTTAIVGASNKSGGVGAAYTFETTNGTTWTQASKITASDGAANDQFGYSVAISTNGVIVGAYYKSSGVGAAYLY
jgi:hypothetical protein